MSLRLLIATGLAVGATACAASRSDAPAEVKSVVVDERARQAAQSVATREADSEDALDAAEDATTQTPN